MYMRESRIGERKRERDRREEKRRDWQCVIELPIRETAFGGSRVEQEAAAGEGEDEGNSAAEADAVCGGGVGEEEAKERDRRGRERWCPLCVCLAFSFNSFFFASVPHGSSTHFLPPVLFLSLSQCHQSNQSRNE